MKNSMFAFFHASILMILIYRLLSAVFGAFIYSIITPLSGCCM